MSDEQKDISSFWNTAQILPVDSSRSPASNNLLSELGDAFQNKEKCIFKIYLFDDRDKLELTAPNSETRNRASLGRSSDFRYKILLL